MRQRNNICFLRPYSWLVLVLAGLLSSCAPTIAPALRQQLDRDLSFAQLAANPESFKGKVVLLGGTIIQTSPKPGETEIEVLEKPLDYFDEPKDTDASGGRFLVRIDGFLDPAVYRQNRKITVVGEVLGKEVRPLGSLAYTYPVLQAKQLKLWPPRIAAPPPWPYWGPPYWSWHPWWWPYYWWP